MMTTGVSTPFRVRASTTSMPSLPGIFTSQKITSCLPSRAAFRPAFPSSASSTVCFSYSRMSFRACRMRRSSSMMRMWAMSRKCGKSRAFHCAPGNRCPRVVSRPSGETTPPEGSLAVRSSPSPTAGPPPRCGANGVQSPRTGAGQGGVQSTRRRWTCRECDRGAIPGCPPIPPCSWTSGHGTGSAACCRATRRPPRAGANWPQPSPWRPAN